MAVIPISFDFSTIRYLTQLDCDETPFIMFGEKDATDPQSKDYMWVYHSPGTYYFIKITSMITTTVRVQRR